MQKPKSFFRLFTESGPLVALAVAIGLLTGIAGPASAQFFNFPTFGSPSPQRQQPRSGTDWFGNDIFAPFQKPPPQRRAVVQEDFSRAPAPAKRETPAERNVLVLGDAMADWLAYGLEDAYSEQPDMGVIRKHRTVSGLIKYQPKGEPSDWVGAARGILANEKPDAIVVMLGLNDRVSMREPAVDKSKTDKKDDKKAATKPADAKPGEAKPAAKPEGAADTAAKPAEKPAETEVADDTESDTAPAATPEKSTRAAGGLYEFRDERWVELYAKKIEEMVAVLKSKGVPVLWVGLPAVRGAKGTSDTLFLNALYRDGAAKAGITYVDVWDGFVDEAGRFLQKGPDFEGQIRQLRTYDGTYFTKAGARKLAHYVEREVTRLLASRSGPIALPVEPATPDASALPGQPAPRPIAGPILPLVASSVSSDQLLGGPGTRPASVDALAARTLVKGEALAPPAGRADDFAWPRREIGREQAKEPAKEPGSKGDTPVASTAPNATSPTAAPAAPARPLAPRKQFRPAQTEQPRDFFGFGTAPRQAAPPPRAPGNPGAPRPPGNVGRSAEVPAGAFTR